MTRERIERDLGKIRDKLANLEARKRDLEGQLQEAEDAEKMRIIQKNRITVEQLILMTKVSEEEINSLLRKKRIEEQEKQEKSGEEERHEQEEEGQNLSGPAQEPGRVGTGAQGVDR